jgi:hypothetical protein
MSSKKPDPSVTAAQAIRLVELLAATDPASAKERAGSAERHFERTRPARDQAPVMPDAGASSPPAGSATAGGPRLYLHPAPTRSPVLNAFLNELGGEEGDEEELVPANVDVFNEHTLAPRLVELARKRVVSMLLSVGKPDVGLFLAEMSPIANEHAARLFMRQAVHVGGGLGAIARDYARYHRRSRAPDHDDQHASCIMATFAGRLNAMAEKLLGPHVRDDVRDELMQLTSQGRAPARRTRASELRAPQGAARPAATTALDVPSSAKKPRGA